MAAVALPSLNINSYEVPSRVNCNVRLQLGESKIPGAGRGIFVLQDVKEGGLIFEVPNVLISTINNDCLETTCDFCYAHRSRYGQTDPRPDLSFTLCETCKVVSFCSSTCSEAAWAAYHKFECPNLTKIIASEPACEGKANPRSDEFRTIVRILSLHDGGIISESEWEEIMGLIPQPSMSNGQSRYIKGIEVMIALISKHGITKLSEEDVEKVIRAYFNNRCFIQLWTPCPLPVSNIHRYRTVDAPVGECLEPFFSMINHCCDPNSTWLSEGRNLQIRAERDITAGEELTICYGWSDTLQDRKSKLSAWIGSCGCALCITPPREPRGHLRQQVEKLITAEGEAATPTQARSISLQFAIREMERNGLEIGAWPMRHLHAQLFRCRCGQYDGPSMLKIWLKLYFFVEPAMRPHECLANRQRDLTVLVYLLDLKDPTYAKLEPYPEVVVKLAPWLHYQLRVRLLHDVRQCHSKNSYCLNMEEENFERDFGQLERDAEAMVVKNERDYVPYTVSELSKWAFVKDMNALLSWADLPARTESQLLNMHSI